ncbi:unnamed protein product [Rhizoctonia solani]|uniref:F-box domain-containing protein n=1 Tax=Rhizoctonia solani TaxID=456999 RepID=A0A8H3GLV2_9AGAM|nr:unnamed protein product [Rhizoctonia solani]
MSQSRSTTISATSQVSRPSSTRTTRRQVPDGNQQEKERNRKITVCGDLHTLRFDSSTRTHTVPIKQLSASPAMSFASSSSSSAESYSSGSELHTSPGQYSPYTPDSSPEAGPVSLPSLFDESAAITAANAAADGILCDVVSCVKAFKAPSELDFSATTKDHPLFLADSEKNRPFINQLCKLAGLRSDQVLFTLDEYERSFEYPSELDFVSNPDKNGMFLLNNDKNKPFIDQLRKLDGLRTWLEAIPRGNPEREYKYQVVRAKIEQTLKCMQKHQHKLWKNNAMAYTSARNSQSGKTRGKRHALSVLVDDVEDDVGHNAEFVEPEQEEQQLPPAKRQRTTQPVTAHVSEKQVVGKLGRLGSLTDIPTEIFTEIASYLWPLDIITLARLYKSFRKLLMNRSSIHIWQKAVNNVPRFPHYPADMSLPRYLVLVFVEACTSCGEVEDVEVDTILRVRLCASCRKTCKQVDSSALVILHAHKLSEFLKVMNLVREQEMDEIKAEREAEIERRLEDLDGSKRTRTSPSNVVYIPTNGFNWYPSQNH